MRNIQIPKKNGTFRIIYIPNKEEKRVLRDVLVDLNNKQKKLCSDCIHGFMPGRSPVTNALSHIGFDYTTCFDLKDFFDTVKKEQVKKYLNKQQLEICFVDGAPRQGLPTSPVVANLAAISLDDAIQKFIKKSNVECVYTRYADDLSFSYNRKEFKNKLLECIPNIISTNGFYVNNKKTRTLCAKSGRRHITGVAVDYLNIYPTRNIKRKLRAAKHQNNYMQARGLLEWSKLKLPVPPKYNRKKRLISIRREISIVKKLWKVKGEYIDLPDKGEDEIIDEDTIITGDPVYMLGMSTITDGWKSCMGFKNRGYNRQLVYPLVHLEGVKIAAILGKEYVSYGGVMRRPMLARCLVFTLEDNQRVYRSFYGKSLELKNLLMNKLDSYGIGDSRNVNVSGVVIGELPKKNLEAYIGHGIINGRKFFL